MSSIRNQQEMTKQAAEQQSVTDGIVDNWLDNTAGSDSDASTGAAAKGAHGKGGKVHAGAKGIGLAGASKDALDHGVTDNAAMGKEASSQSALPSAQDDGSAHEAHSHHFDAIDKLVGDSSNQASTTAASTTLVNADGTTPTTAQQKAVDTAKAQLTTDMAATPPNTATISSDTKKYVQALKAAGQSDPQITQSVSSMAAAPGVPSDIANALVEAAKDGINTNDDNQDKEASLVGQKSVDARKDTASAQAQQARSDASNDDSGGSDGGDGGSSSDGSSTAGSGADSGVSSDSNQADASGTGNYGNVNSPANSKEYKGMTLQQLEQSSGPVGDAIRKRPDLVADIEKASAATGVPSGLLAGLCYMETSFGQDDTTTTDSSGDATGGVTQVQQSIVSAYVPGGQMSNAADNIMACAKGLSSFYNASQSWGAALRGWNSFDPTDSGNVKQVASLTDLTQTDGGGISNYVSNILNYICEGKDAPG